ncbi:hypothetical protein [Massilia yuzhufengensis]|uniref:Membrane-bound lysozyme-inhibitor of c-type lysozyme n=1 Tax=Massilia yuzhufengensis TaxID=1164594 RepID=A0A1I1NJV5_9BURK|nr:hypothetical protein [Massilia yuzhufengensis]SFC95013.1 hypothetical protein SAMN05216204_11317 [Massilia yuzhufengensis]
MSHYLSKFLAAGAFALAAGSMCAPVHAAPETKHPKAEAVVKAKAKADAKAKKSAKPAKGAAAADASVRAAAAFDAAEETEPDITDTITTEYACELNNKVTIYTNEKDPANIALRWKKRVHRLTRVGTTTGALRFENPYWGLIWIGIPSKGILLDSRLNRQLANECKNAVQAAPVTAALPEEKKS